jgi:hypothetical protein
MSDDAEIETAIQEKGLTAPRITPEHIRSMIVDETYTVMPSGKAMVCELTLKNGFTVRGESAVVSKENFNEEIGRKVAFIKARDQIWLLEGYLLQQRLVDEARRAAHASKEPQDLEKDPPPAG